MGDDDLLDTQGASLSEQQDDLVGREMARVQDGVVLRLQREGLDEVGPEPSLPVLIQMPSPSLRPHFCAS